MRNKKKKHDKILMFAKSKFNSIEFVAFFKEKDKHDKTKENVRNINEK